MYMKYIAYIVITLVSALMYPSSLFAVTQTGGGYVINSQINAITGLSSGVGYTSQTAGNPISTLQTGNGYTAYSGGYLPAPIVDVCSNISGYQTTVPSGYTVTAGICNPVSSGGGGGGGSSKQTCPAGTSGVYPNCTITCPVGTVGVYPSCVTTAINTDAQLALSCSESLVVKKPLRYNSIFYWNDPNDVKIVQKFLNAYEGESLSIDGKYTKQTFDAVVRWQEKYRAVILNPWGLKKGNGRIYVTSIAQMKRQQQARCATQALVPTTTPNVCPYFTTPQTIRSSGVEVKKIQDFLNKEVNARLVVDGNYDFVTQNAVRAFQLKYKKEILSVWNLRYATGWWYIST
jgi:hypothetical protein